MQKEDRQRKTDIRSTIIKKRKKINIIKTKQCWMNNDQEFNLLFIQLCTKFPVINQLAFVLVHYILITPAFWNFDVPRSDVISGRSRAGSGCEQEHLHNTRHATCRNVASYVRNDTMEKVTRCVEKEESIIVRDMIIEKKYFDMILFLRYTSKIWWTCFSLHV